MKTARRHGRKGFVLISVLLITAISLLLLIPYADRILTDLKLTSIINNSTLALDLAEAGAERALWEIIYNSKASDFTIPVSSLQSSTGDNMGQYEATVTFPGNNSISIRSYGYVPNKSSYKAKKIIMVTYEKNNFNKAIGAQGATGISLGKNSIIDSYDSDDGTYDETHANSYGNIATNGPITIPSSSDVWGNANPGEDFPFSEEPDNVHGSWGTLPTPLVYDPIPADTLSEQKTSGLAAPDHGVIIETEPDSYTRTDDNLVVNNSITLTGGSYYFKSITVNQQGNIIIQGDSTIYVDAGNITVNLQGDMNVSGQATFYVDGGNINIDTQGDINNTGVPSNLKIYSTGTTITLLTQTDFYGAIYAPNAAISLTSKTAGGEIYGAIACNSFVSGTNTGVHFDKALLNVSLDFLPSGVTSWQEVE